ncbi:unnamed protein product [Paramecium sonneborni]|uniref:Uncharacterized protein n=1 Tax=Paramecium sonneborni TaxID=65129 RepID=A0A8S1P4S9_9CILI|nr:unnamed protein product [Paramecium sonneborni]
MSHIKQRNNNFITINIAFCKMKIVAPFFTKGLLRFLIMTVSNIESSSFIYMRLRQMNIIQKLTKRNNIDFIDHFEVEQFQLRILKN